MQLLPPREKGAKKGTQAIRISVGFTTDHHADMRIEIPSQHIDGVLRRKGRLAKGGKVRVTVDQECRASRRLHTPATPSRLKRTIALLCAHVESGRRTIDRSSAVALEMRWNADRFIAIGFHEIPWR
ncbi:MAG: hypothetical protein H8K07_02865 [Nitrospira sp.]|nr:hypothetical protein [Nitrospira sp.]